MDHGPVDAGPNADVQYDDPTHPPSPGRERKPIPRQQFFRAPLSFRAQVSGNQPANEESVSDGKEDRKGHTRIRSGASQHSQDLPTYYPVGATAADTEWGVKEEDGPLKDIGSLAESGTAAESVGRRLYKYTLYETNARYWITGSDIAEKQFRLLRIDRTSPPGQIALFEDETTYDRRQMRDVLASIDEGNQTIGGLRMKCAFWGLLGFIRFTESYYMLIVTKRQQTALIGGHYVYQIDGTELVPLTTGSSNRFAQNRNPEESRFLSIFNNLDLTKSFYFSYSYDITQSLQTNIIRQRKAMNHGQQHADQELNSVFVWNHHLLQPAVAALKHPLNWCLPIIHGYIDQATLDIFGRVVYVTIIGRRSRFYAGARFLKRGVNDMGYVANDVETEQIVSEKITTSFHAPGPRLYASSAYTSYVQHRGSIPLYWTQDNSGVTPKPAIDLNLQDPFYQPAALHFDNLFERYGCPVYVLNLVKARERLPRESKLLVEYQKCINYLNQSLPDDKKILYKAFDMSRESKTRGGDVIGSLEVISRDILKQTGFFKNGDDVSDEPSLQNGVARTNCIDCLDRTNAAQFVIGKRAFALQLQALGVIDRDEVDFDTDAVNIFTHMFHHHGDTIAVQYGGSHLVNTMATYRKLNHWQSQSRDMVESFKRYYHNSFLDNQRQDAYNLFLGNYVWAQDSPLLWDLASDYYLHHNKPSAMFERRRRSYNQWYTPEFLQERKMPPKAFKTANESTVVGSVAEHDDYWLECYRPAALSSLGKVYSYRINAASRYLPERPHRESRYDFSPFKIRQEPQRQSSDTSGKHSQPNQVKILEPENKQRTASQGGPIKETQDLSRYSSTAMNKNSSILRGQTATSPSKQPTQPPDKSQRHQWTLNQIHTQSLNPSVSEKEAREYARYIAHPLTLPLVTSKHDTEVPSDHHAAADYIEYTHRPGGSQFDEFDQEEADKLVVGEADLHSYNVFLAEAEREDALTVTEDDGDKKRYKAYRQWLKGRSLFKQSKVDPEFKANA